MSDPFWTVIVPTKGNAPYLPACLGSIPARQDIEVLIRFNPDDDGYPLVTEIPPNASTWCNGQDLGCYGSINACLRRAKGEWVHVLHDDDWLLPDFYPTMRLVCESLPDSFGAASCQYANYYQHDGSLRRPEWQRRPSGPMGRWLAGQLRYNNPLQVPAVVFRRSALETVGPFREDMPFAGDWEFYSRLLTRFDWWHEAADLARYRIHPGRRAHAMLRDGRAAKDCAEARRLARQYMADRKAVVV